MLPLQSKNFKINNIFSKLLKWKTGRGNQKPLQCLWGELAQISTFQNTFFSQPIVQDTVKIPQQKVYSLFLRNLFRVKNQFIKHTLDQICFGFSLNPFTEQDLLLLKMKISNHGVLKYFEFLLISFFNWNKQAQLILRGDFCRSPDNNINELRWNQSMLTEKAFVQKSKQNLNTGFHSVSQIHIWIVLKSLKKDHYWSFSSNHF